MQTLKEQILEVLNLVYDKIEDPREFYLKNSINDIKTKLEVIDKIEVEDDKAIIPDYYHKGDVSCREAQESAVIDKNGMEAIQVSNIIKYLWRYESKNGLQDIKKAKNYLQRLEELVAKREQLENMVD